MGIEQGKWHPKKVPSWNQTRDVVITWYPTSSVWLNMALPQESFSVFSVRTEESGKSKDGGVSHDIWDFTNPWTLQVSPACLTWNSLRSHAIYFTSNSPWSSSQLCQHQTKYPDGALIVAGDFYKANPTKVLLNFHQHVSFWTIDILHSRRATRLIFSHHLASQTTPPSSLTGI